MRNIPYGRQYIDDDDIAEVVNVLRSDFLTQGPKIKAFEEAFSEYVGSDFAVAVSNGTAALHLCAMALNVQAGDKWLTTPITFVASANCIKYCGGDVEFVDIDPKTYCIDLDKLEAKLESAPKGMYKGVIPVDFAGYPVDMERLFKIAKRFNLKIIEDACHAPGGYFVDSEGEEQKCGNGKFVDLSIFSFHPVKHIATGEGGMITTNNKALYEKLCLLRTHGITRDESLLNDNQGAWYYEMVDLGYNYRLSDLQAALGVSQLKRASTRLKKRMEIAEKYNSAFADINEIVTPFVSEKSTHAYHLYVIQVEARKELYDYLREFNIFTQVHYIPVHTMPYYRNQMNEKNEMPVAEAYYQKCLSLPMFPTLTDEEQEHVIKKLIKFIKK